MKRFYTITLFSLLHCYIFAQENIRTITGTITSISNEVVIGASVLEEGTTNGTTSDIDGKYVIQCKTGSTLIISYLGSKTQSIVVGNEDNINIVLQDDNVLLNQVVVIGYGVQKKSDLTGSVSSLKGEEITKIATPSFAQAIQGKIAGVYASTSSGRPGDGAVIRVRGTGTLNNANPLYVIDGMIAYDANYLNTQDIESVEVLKDASSAAIYGSRGANGVIIITTKSGKNKTKGEVTLSAYTASQTPVKYISLLNGAEFATAYNQLRGRAFYANPAQFGEGTDWQKEIMQTAPMRNMQLGVSGGNEAMNYNISGSLLSQDGILKNTSYDLSTIRLNTTFKVNSWFTIQNNMSYAATKSQNGPNVVSSAYRMPSLLTVKDSTGKFTDPTFFGLAIGNPAADQFYKSNNFTRASSLLGNISGSIKFLKHFIFKTNVGYDVNQFKFKYFEPQFQVSPSQLNKSARLSQTNGDNQNWIFENTLNYLQDFGKHSVGALIGYTAEERRSENLGGSREHFPGTAPELLYLSSGNDTTQMNFGGASDEALVSYLFRTNYTYDSKCLMTASMRIDQSSRFKSGFRTGYFPSIGLGWNLGKEDFISKLNIFDALKLRASYGILGNQAVNSRYPPTAIVNSGLYAVLGASESIQTAATILSVSNPELRWESAKQTDIGLEMGFFEGRLTSEFDWYNRNTYDIIADVPIPNYVGSSGNPFVNTASVINKGLELALNYRDKHVVDYSIGGNISTVNNEVTKLAAGKTEIFSAFINGEAATRTIVGLPIGAFYGYQTDGVFSTAEELKTSPKFGSEELGDLKYIDNNGDGKITALDRVYLGSPIPTLMYGVNAKVGYKGVELSADLFGVSGNKVFNEKATARFGVYNWEKRIANAWTKDNINSDEPRVTNGGHNYRPSDRYLEDGSFMRLRNVELGYTLPQSILSKVKIQTLRFYVSGTNLFTKQTYSGYNPEFPNSGNSFNVGFDSGAYPISRTILFGINTKF
jgi:TonB-linked SusC/RagA family outer membrane protein